MNKSNNISQVILSVIEGKGANKKTWIVTHPNLQEKGVFFQDEYTKEEAKNEYINNVVKLYFK